jgi:hypothetical protein
MAPGTTGRADDHLADVAGALQELQSSHSALQTVEEVPGDGEDGRAKAMAGEDAKMP